MSHSNQQHPSVVVLTGPPGSGTKTIMGRMISFAGHRYVPVKMSSIIARWCEEDRNIHDLVMDLRWNAKLLESDMALRMLKQRIYEDGVIFKKGTTSELQNLVVEGFPAEAKQAQAFVKIIRDAERTARCKKRHCIVVELTLPKDRAIQRIVNRTLEAKNAKKNFREEDLDCEFISRRYDEYCKRTPNVIEALQHSGFKHARISGDHPKEKVFMDMLDRLGMLDNYHHHLLSTAAEDAGVKTPNKDQSDLVLAD